jgi:hypothetical protein
MHTQLVDVLSLEQLPDDERAHSLRVLNALLSTQVRAACSRSQKASAPNAYTLTQEDKSQAVSAGAAKPLTKLLQSHSKEVRVLSCSALASLCQLLMGRASVVSAGGLVALAAALQDTPEAAALALKVCCCPPATACTNTELHPWVCRPQVIGIQYRSSTFLLCQ